MRVIEVRTRTKIETPARHVNRENIYGSNQELAVGAKRARIGCGAETANDEVTTMKRNQFRGRATGLMTASHASAAE
jgi:hypothetical protein